MTIQELRRPFIEREYRQTLQRIHKREPKNGFLFLIAAVMAALAIFLH